MNRIVIGSNYKMEGEHKSLSIEDGILKLIIQGYDELHLDYNGIDTFEKMDITVLENSHLYLLDTKYQANDKVYEYNIILKENSTFELDKYNDTDELIENWNIFLEGRNSRIEVHNSTISNNNQKYVQNIYHKNQDTNSYVVNRGISGKGNVNFHVNTYVESGSKESTVNQNSKIIMLENNESSIQPNLYIDENDVIANHGASIGKFRDQEIFYLQSRGLNKKESMQLLIQAFLLDGMKANAKKELENIINKEGGWKHE